MKGKPKGVRTQGRAKKWVPVPDPKRPGSKVHVPLPVDADIALDKHGRIASVKTGEPNPEAVAEAAQFVETLEANGQISRAPGPLPPGATHKVEPDVKGQKRLKRKRFSAL